MFTSYEQKTFVFDFPLVTFSSYRNFICLCCPTRIPRNIAIRKIVNSSFFILDTTHYSRICQRKGTCISEEIFGNIYPFGISHSMTHIPMTCNRWDTRGTSASWYILDDNSYYSTLSHYIFLRATITQKDTLWLLPCRST